MRLKTDITEGMKRKTEKTKKTKEEVDEEKTAAEKYFEKM